MVGDDALEITGQLEGGLICYRVGGDSMKPFGVGGEDGEEERATDATR